MSCKFQSLCPLASDECMSVRCAADCKCYEAVMHVFERIVKSEPKTVAFEAALRVYRHHYPQDKKAIAHLTVERWVHSRQIH